MKRKIKNNLAVILFVFGITLTFGQTNPGDIAFVAFNADGNDDIAFVTFVDIPANTVIWFTDNEWNGVDAFNDLNEGETRWIHNAIVPAGTVVSFDKTGAASIGTISSAAGFVNLNASNEDLFALLSEPSTSTMVSPGFLAGISSDNVSSIVNTGLALGVNFIDFNNDHDGFEYTGLRSGEASFSSYLPLIMDVSNWQDETSDGTNILPIDLTVFTISAGGTPTVGFDSDTNSIIETDSGTNSFVAPITMNIAPSSDVVVNVTLNDGTATLADNDYSGPASNDLTFTTGATYPLTLNADFTIVGDTNNELDEDFTVEFTVTSGTANTGTTTHTVTILDDDSNEILVEGNSLEIENNDITPDTADDTNFGTVDTSSGTVAHTFTISNTGVADLILTGGSPYIVIGGTHVSDFTLTLIPTSPIIMASSTTFEITFDPSVDGLREATISIANNDNNENPYSFNIQGTGSTPIASCSELYISEYVEGASFNKYFEIYNPTSSIIDLSLGNYKVQKHTNGGSSSTSELILSGTIAPYDVLIIANSGADVTILDAADIINGITSFNGDDVIELQKNIGSWIVIDKIGENTGTDPGSGWDVAGVSNATANHTMVRKSSVEVPNSNWTTSAGTTAIDSEWIVSAQDDFSNIGYHLSTCVACVNLPVVWNGLVWSNGTGPDVDTPAIINGDYNTNTNGVFETCRLLNPTFTITVEANTYFQVENDIFNTGVIIVENEGSIVQVNDAAIIVGTDFQIQKTTTPFVMYDYTYWSSPVENADLGTVFATNLPNYIFDFTTANFDDTDNDTYDDNADDWNVVTGLMTTAKGYIVMGEGAVFPVPFPLPTTSSQQTVSFDGKINNGVKTIALSLDANATDSFDNQNLIGNPYPSAIDAVKFLNVTTNPNLSGTLYFWTHNTQVSSSTSGPDTYNFTNDDYMTYVSGTGFVAGACSGCVVPGDDLISSGQGFFADVTTAGTATFNNDMRVTTGNDNFFRSSETRDRIWVNFTNEEGLFRQTLVGFFANATNGHDRNYDGKRLVNGDNFDFYTLMNNNRYAIQGFSTLANDKTVSLGIEAITVGDFQISIDHLEGDLENVNVYLKDNLLNTIHDLKVGNYNLTINQIGEFNERFELFFTRTVLSANNELVSGSDLIVSNLNDDIHVEILNGNIIRNVKAFDVIGKLMFESSPNNDNVNIRTKVNKGTILFIKVQLENGQTLTKKFIKL